MSDTTATDSPVGAPAAQEPDWAARFAAAELILKHAGDFLRITLDERRISGAEYSRYAGMITDAHQEAVVEFVTPQMRAEIAEAACVTIRQRAIGLREADVICQEGLDNFLEAAGLEED
jgi:hypothetical protein